MRLKIPTIGDTIKLVSPWSFVLHEEQRNFTLISHLFPEENVRKSDVTYYWWEGKKMKNRNATLPSGLELAFDRIYLAKVNTAYSGGTVKDYHSVTFVIKKNSILNNNKQIRFWVKLEDANRIECEFLGSQQKLGEQNGS